jgi:hypothetical protein
VLPPKTPNYILRFTYIGDALRYVRLRGMTLTSIIGLRSVVIFLQLVHQPRMVCGISQFIGGSCPIRMIAVGDMRSGVIFLSTETGPSID